MDWTKSSYKHQNTLDIYDKSSQVLENVINQKAHLAKENLC